MANFVQRGMISAAAALKITPVTLKRRIKWVVYAGIIYSFIKFSYDDIKDFISIDKLDFTFSDYSYGFANSADAVGWIGLIILLELKGYYAGKLQSTLSIVSQQIGRILCYAILVHSAYWFVTDLSYLYDSKANPMEIEYACDAEEVDEELINFMWNDEYTIITPENCDSLGEGNEWFIADWNAITDRKGIERGITYTWSNTLEMALWLIVMVLIEVRIQLEQRGLNPRRLLKVFDYISVTCYLNLILVITGYWAFIGMGYDAYDQTLWVMGYFFIELKLIDVPDEKKEKEDEEKESTEFTGQE